LFLKARNSLDRSRPSLPSSSRVGLGLSFSWKVDATYEMAPLIVPSAKVHEQVTKIPLRGKPYGKCSHESDVLKSCESVEEEVVSKSNGFCVCTPSPPGLILVLVCRNCGFTGSIRSNQVSHETISLGSGTILKSGGT
jgi:hypothetical protein